MENVDEAASALRLVDVPFVFGLILGLVSDRIQRMPPRQYRK